MDNKHYTLGIDIGSTTVKIAILDDAHHILFSDYKRHYANIRETLSSLKRRSHSCQPFGRSLCAGGYCGCHLLKGAGSQD